MARLAAAAAALGLFSRIASRISNARGPCLNAETALRISQGVSPRVNQASAVFP